MYRPKQENGIKNLNFKNILDFVSFYIIYLQLKTIFIERK